MNTLTEDTIRSHTSDQSFERGREYYRSGAIYNAIRHTVPASLWEGNTLLADCEGTYSLLDVNINLWKSPFYVAHS